MIKIKTFSLLLALCSSYAWAQVSPKDSLIAPMPSALASEKPVKIINPEGKFYVGVEMGSNKSNTLEPKTIYSQTVESQLSGLQLGAMAEYYFARHWSLLAKLKYYKCNLINPSLDENISTNIISLPIAIKWEFRVQHNFSASVKLGFSISKDFNMQNAKSKPSRIYHNSGAYVRPFGGLGVNYFINKRLAAYADYDVLFGPTREALNIYGQRFSLNTYVNNHHFSLGLKYSLN